MKSFLKHYRYFFNFIFYFNAGDENFNNTKTQSNYNLAF